MFLSESIWSIRKVIKLFVIELFRIFLEIKSIRLITFNQMDSSRTIIF